MLPVHGEVYVCCDDFIIVIIGALGDIFETFGGWHPGNGLGILRQEFRDTARIFDLKSCKLIGHYLLMEVQTRKKLMRLHSMGGLLQVLGKT